MQSNSFVERLVYISHLETANVVKQTVSLRRCGATPLESCLINSKLTVCFTSIFPKDARLNTVWQQPSRTKRLEVRLSATNQFGTTLVLNPTCCRMTN